MGERTELHDGDVMPIGKHKGKPLGEVPDSYWGWFVDQPWAKRKYPDLYAYGMLTERDDDGRGDTDWHDGYGDGFND